MEKKKKFDLWKTFIKPDIKEKPKRQSNKFAYAKIKSILSPRKATKKAKRKNASEYKKESNYLQRI